MVLSRSALAPPKQPRQEEGNGRRNSQPESSLYKQQFSSRYIMLRKIPALSRPCNEFQIWKQDHEILKWKRVEKNKNINLRGALSSPTKSLFITQGKKYIYRYFLQQLHSLEVEGCSLPTFSSLQGQYSLGRLSSFSIQRNDNKMKQMLPVFSWMHWHLRHKKWE